MPKIFRLLYLHNIFLILMVMTNHYHFFVFDFIGGIAGADIPYRYGTGYFLVVAWMAVEIVAFILLLLKKSHVPGKHKRIIAPVIPIIAGVFYLPIKLPLFFWKMVQSGYSVRKLFRCRGRMQFS